MLSIKNKTIAYRILFILSLTLLFSSGHIENPDTHLRLTQARLLVEDGTLKVPHGFGEVSHGNLAVNTEGDQYSVYNPGQIFLFAPVYIIARYLVTDSIDSYYTAAFLASFLGYIIYGLVIVVFWEFGKRLNIPKKKRLLITLLFAFTSYCFAHAQDSYEHIYEALFLLLSLWLVFRKDVSAELVLLSALSIGFGLLFRSSIAIAIPGILLLIPNWRLRITFLAGLIPFFLVLLYYNYIRFGNPFENGYTIAWLRAFGQTPQTSFNISNLPKHTFGLLFSFGKGLLFFSPSLLLIFLSIRKFMSTQRRLFYSIALISSAYIGLYATNFAWHGSAWNWGPRYIIPIVPLLYLALFYLSFDKRRIVLAISLFSFMVQMLAVTTFYKRELIKTLLEDGDIFWSDEYFFSPIHSPIKGQVVSLIEVTNSMVSDVPKKLFLPKGPWRNESRPASQQEMLQQSIDLNVPNFWWVRTFYSNTSWLLQFLSASLAFLAAGILITQFRTLWKSTTRKETGI